MCNHPCSELTYLTVHSHSVQTNKAGFITHIAFPVIMCSGVPEPPIPTFSSTERLWRRYTSHFLGFIPHYLLHERDQIIRVYLDADARTVYNAPGVCTPRQLLLP